MTSSVEVLALLALLAALVSWRFTELAIRYANRVALVDQPGARRSHAVATPRGGGIAIVLAVLLFGTFPILDPAWWPLAIATVAVAAIGWIDDHRALSPWPRLAVHLAAAALVALQPDVVTVAIATLAVAWSINLHNFMDGINGILAAQAIFVGAVAATLGFASHDDASAFLGAGLAAAALGFLPLNFPRARIFMGDVGSGAIGLLIGWLSLRLPLGDALILSSAFLVDATLTLATRMLAGKRWYAPHREHLYQWLVRSRFSHAQAVGCYALWNVMLVLPALMLHRKLVNHEGAVGLVYSPMVPAAVLALGTVAWFLGKRACLIRVKHPS